MFAEYSLNGCQGITKYELQERLAGAIRMNFFYLARQQHLSAQLFY